MEMETGGLELVARLAERGLDADFLRVDRVNGVEQPKYEEHGDATGERPASAGNAPLETVSAAIEDVFEARGSASLGSASALWRLSPGTAGIAVAAPAPRIVVP